MGQMKPYLMEDAPDVLNIGTRCELHGFGFHWEPCSSKPYFSTPGGKQVDLVTIDQCPYLEDEFNCEGGVLVDAITKEAVSAAPGVKRRPVPDDEEDDGPTTGIAGIVDLDEDDPGMPIQLDDNSDEECPHPLVDSSSEDGMEEDKTVNRPSAGKGRKFVLSDRGRTHRRPARQ